MRQNERRRVRNKARRTTLKTQIRKFLDALIGKDTATAEKELRATAKALDRTASKRTIHPNTAARRKSRLTKRLNAAKAGAKA